MPSWCQERCEQGSSRAAGAAWGSLCLGTRSPCVLRPRRRSAGSSHLPLHFPFYQESRSVGSGLLAGALRGHGDCFLLFPYELNLPDAFSHFLFAPAALCCAHCPLPGAACAACPAAGAVPCSSPPCASFFSPFAAEPGG